MNNLVGVAEGAVQSPVADLLKAIDSFIDKDILVDEDKLEGVESIGPGEPLKFLNTVVQ